MDFITKNYQQIEKMIGWAYQRHSSDFIELRIEYDDFQSYAYEILVVHLHKWDKNISNLSTYLGTVLDNKALSMIRDAKRQKRSIYYKADSLDRELNTGDNITLGDTIPVNDNTSDATRFIKYFESLSPMQQKIISMIGWGYSRTEIIESLNITANHFNSLFNDCSSILKRKQFFGKE